MPCVDVREAICKFLDDIVCFSTYCITRTVISQRHAQTSSPFFDWEKRSVHVFVSMERGYIKQDWELMDWYIPQAPGYFWLTDFPGSKLLWIDRLPRLQADEFTDSQGSRPQLQAHLDWQTAPAPDPFWMTDCPRLQAHLDWQTAPAPGSFGLTHCPSSRLIWIDRLLGGWVHLLFSMESCYFMLMYINMYVSTHCGVFENYNQFFWFTSCYTGCAGIHALEVLQQGDMGLVPIRETAKMTGIARINSQLSGRKDRRNDHGDPALFLTWRHDQQMLSGCSIV